MRAQTHLAYPLNGSSSLCVKQGHLKGDLSKLSGLGDGSYAPEIHIQQDNGFELKESSSIGTWGLMRGTVARVLERRTRRRRPWILKRARSRNAVQPSSM